MCDKADNRCFFVSDFVCDWYKSQEMSGRVIPEDSLMLIYSLNRLKIKKCVMKLLMIVWQQIVDAFPGGLL